MRRYKELRYDGKIYNETYKIDKILIDSGFEWFLDCEVENVRLEIQYETLIFNSGVFFNGTWYYGVFRDGEWKSGTWNNGVWYNGIWRNGTFESGLIFDGKFFNGKIEKGTIRGGEFYDMTIDKEVVREDNYKPEKDDNVQPVEPIPINELKLPWDKFPKPKEKPNLLPNYSQTTKEIIPIGDVKKYKNFIEDEEDYEEDSDDVVDNPIDPFGEEDWDEKEPTELEPEEQKKRDYVTNIIVKIDKIVDRLLDMSISDYIKSPYLVSIPNRKSRIGYKKRLRNGKTISVTIENGHYGNTEDLYDFRMNSDTHINNVNLSLDTIQTFNELKDKIRILSKRINKRDSFDEYDDMFENKNPEYDIDPFEEDDWDEEDITVTLEDVYNFLRYECDSENMERKYDRNSKRFMGFTFWYNGIYCSAIQNRNGKITIHSMGENFTEVTIKSIDDIVPKMHIIEDDEHMSFQSTDESKIVEDFDFWKGKFGKPKKTKIEYDIDPFEEEDWDEVEKEFIDLQLFLSEKQKPLYDDGTPLQTPWVEKYHVLFKKGDKYYILGDYRFGSNDFKMFYEDYTGIERKDLREYKGEVYRSLYPKEKSQVMKILSSRAKFTRGLFDNENGKSYDDIINDFINES